MKNSKTVLIIGGSGFIGMHLAYRLREEHKVFLTFSERRVKIPGVTLLPFNVSERSNAKRIIFSIQPNVIIYLAGKYQSFSHEGSMREMERIETAGSSNLLATANILNPKFIFLSHPYVFDGNRGNYHESDVTLPGNILGKVKFNSENYIRGRSLNYVIIRIPPVIGIGNTRHPTFLDELRIKLKLGESVPLPDDEFHSFTNIYGVVDMIEAVVRSNMRNQTIHYGGLTKVTPFQMARSFAERFGFNKDLVVPTTDMLAYRENPFDFSLNFSKAVKDLKIKPMFLDDSFNAIEKNLSSNFEKKQIFFY